jgi:hypothetical protein
MKNKFLYISGILILITFIYSVSAALDTSLCNPTIQIVNQDPYPAIPDSYVKVVIQVSNLGSCNGFAVKLNPEYPFSLDPGVDSVQTIAKEPYAPGFKTSWDVPYKIRVANDALEGDYYLKLYYHQGVSEDFITNYIVKSLNISITDAQTDFDVVVQESTGSQISLGIVNSGKNTANSLVVGIPQQENYRVSGTSEQIVGNLAAGDYTIITFNVAQGFGGYNQTRNRQYNASNQPPNQQIPQNQPLKIKIDYTDGIGKRRSVIKEIPLSGSLTQTNITSRITNGQFNRNNSNNTGLSIWWIIVIGIVIIIILVIVLLKYGENIRILKILLSGS